LSGDEIVKTNLINNKIIKYQMIIKESIAVRRVESPDELHRIIDFSNFIFSIDKNHPNGNLDRWLERWNNGIVVIAEDAHQSVVSFIYIIQKHWQHNASLKDSWHIWLCGTNPEFRGNGIMSRLYNEAISYCDLHFSSFLTVATLPRKFPEMVKFIEKFEFQTFSEKIVHEFGMDLLKIECVKSLQ
jgi:GNAT superfamily N-acetyltransferase